MQMTIARRLGIMLTGALIALLVVGGFGVYTAHDMTGDVRDGNGSTLRALDLLGQAESSFILIRMHVLYHLASPQPDKQAAHEAAIRKEHQDVQKSLEAYEKELAKQPRDRAQLQQDRLQLAGYMQAVDKVIALSSAREQEAAYQLLEKELKPAGEQLTRTLGEHKEINQQKARDMTQHLLEDCQRNTLLTVLVSLTAVALIAGGGWLLARSIGRSLRGLRQTMLNLESNLDFSQRAAVARRDEIGETATAFNHLLERLQHSFRDVTTHTAQVAGAAGGMASLSQQVASSSENQSSAAASMAAAIEEMSVSIGQAGDRAIEAQQASRQSGELATQGERAIVQTVREINLAAEVVLQAETQIQRLDTDSARISNVIAVIKEVAEQTNLLALNAAIEAARAGESGRGFAVVADEVRKLAERTAASTQEIAQTIEAMRQGAQGAVEGMHRVSAQVQRSVVLAEEASALMNRIGESSRYAVSQVGDITHAVAEQSSASQLLAAQVEQIATMAEQGSSAASRSALAAQEVDQLAETMHRVVSVYRV